MTELEALRQFADDARAVKQPDPIVAKALETLDAALNNVDVADVEPIQVVLDPADPPPSTSIDCPICHHVAIPLVRLRSLAICGVCGASLVVDGADVRPARFSDMEDCTADEKAQLVRGRASLARPERRQR